MKNSKSLDLKDGNILFNNINFSYKSNFENKVLKIYLLNFQVEK